MASQKEEQPLLTGRQSTKWHIRKKCICHFQRWININKVRRQNVIFIRRADTLWYQEKDREGGPVNVGLVWKSKTQVNWVKLNINFLNILIKDSAIVMKSISNTVSQYLWLSLVPSSQKKKFIAQASNCSTYTVNRAVHFNLHSTLYTTIFTVEYALYT